MARKGKNKKRERTYSRNELINKCLGIFSSEPTKTFNYKQLSKILEIKNDPERQLVVRILRDLKDNDHLEEMSPGKYRLKSRAGYVVGKIDIAQAGYGFLVSEDMDEDIMIPRNLLHTALDGDTVKVYVYPVRKKRGRPEGEVVQILERSRTNFVGTIEISDQFAFLIIDSKKMPYDLFIPLEKLKGAKNGQKAIARITSWPEKVKNPFGEVVEVLGNPGENDVEMHAILAEFDLPNHFPDEINAAAELISDKITSEDIAERRDFRGVPTFTIDPHDAKDFDDALSIKKLKNGNYEVGVHIADVTHYVKTNSDIEDEAFERATSVYLVDRVVPMLPERLSNYICSLRPNEEKLCFSAVFEINEEAVVINEWIGRTIILSDQRYSYEEAQKIIEGGEGKLKNEILILHKLAQILRGKRYQKGAISFDSIEVKFNLDDKGKPIGVYFKEQKESNQLIEEFMLLANRTTAEFVHNKGKYIQERKVSQTDYGKPKTFVYRIHAEPNPEKLETFNRFISKFGHSIELAAGVKMSKSINKLLDKVEGSPEQHLIETLAVRSMAKAKYSTDNIGHYGLAFPFYTHFTSPIRRYPDMMVHRMLASYLAKGESKNKKKYEQKCLHSSEMEKRAMDAERASVKYKQAEFMQDKVGREFDAIISGLTEWGIYAEIIENKCEGMISVQSLQDDFYEFDEDNYQLKGRNTRKVFQLGDPIKIEVRSVNLAKRLIDYSLAED
ncbi:MAG: ribonuclease R [Bacteroidales bacterium]|nr:ribonuclease R [Bacteroidales bacterium]MCF8389117.1 ribonuclease R [Bacteroidales bacterium]